MKRAVFLDRDGVINVKRDDYVKSIEEFVMLHDAPEAIKLLKEKGFLVIIITNQSAINRGLLTYEELANIHDFMGQKLAQLGTFVDAIYFCPHRPDENCKCRKPESGLIEKAINDHNIIKDRSCFIGDSESDMLAAKKIGVKAIYMKENGSLLEAIKDVI